MPVSLAICSNAFGFTLVSTKTDETLFSLIKSIVCIVLGLKTDNALNKTQFFNMLKKDKKNPDILNYMGFTSRKIGNFSEAEDYYL